MKTTWIPVALVLLFFGQAFAVFAAEKEAISPDVEMAEAIATLKRLYPATTFKEISSTPVDGIYQVVMGRNVAMVDKSGRYFILGHMYDMKEQKDLTEAAIQRNNAIDFSALPLADAVVTVKGNGTRKLAVFSDPDCPYCKQLEATLGKLTDVTVYTFLLPLDGLHPDAKRKSIGVWCSTDRAKAWESLMLENVQPGGSCDDHPLDRISQLAQGLGVSGTPTIVFPDGRVVPGAPRYEQLNQFLGAAK